MTIIDVPHDVRPLPNGVIPEPRPAGFVADVATIAGRALRGVTRDLPTVAPPIFKRQGPPC